MTECLYVVEDDAVRWKKSALKGVDTGSFEIVGDQYGRDGENAYFRNKRIRLKTKVGGSVDAFREIGPAVATDGAWLYHGTGQLEPPAETRDGGFDWSAATYRPFHGGEGHTRGLNLDDGVLSDGSRHFLRSWWGGWLEVPKATIEPLEPSLEEFGNGRYFSDGDFYSYRGEEVQGARGREAHAIAPDVLVAGDDVFVGAAHVEGRSAKDLRWIAGEALHAGATVLSVNGPTGKVTDEVPVAEPESLEDATRAFLDVVLPCAAHAFDRWLPVASDLSQLELDGVPEEHPFPYRLVRVTSDEVCIDVNGEELSAAHDDWYALASRAWARARGRDARLLAYVQFGTMLPGTTALTEKLVGAAATETVALASALERAGQHGSARMLAHLALVRVWWRDHPSLEVLAHLAPELSDAARYDRRRHGFTVTTNFGVVKHIVKEGLLADPDPRVRLEMIDTLIGATIAGAKAKNVLPVAVPALIERTETETDPTVRTAAWIALDACTVTATVSAEVAMPKELERAARHLIEHGVNPDLNRLRLYEALWEQERDDEAEAVAAELSAGPAAERPYPGAYCNREITMNAADALEAVRQRTVRR